jgi:drug/metabolite transporter (DMT)-like permease
MMDNLRGAALMTFAMLTFAVGDMFIKLMADALPTWQIILVLGVGGAASFAILTRAQGQPLFTRTYLTRPILLRNLGELIGTIGFVTAITLTPISSASAILQATPLVVTLGAALFFNDPVGWRRWTAILVGLFGVLLVIRPGMDGFDIRSLFAVQGVIGLALRDLATRSVPRETSSVQLGFLGFLTLIPAAGIVSLFSDRSLVTPSTHIWLLIVGLVLFCTLAYYAIVSAMRVGEVSFVTPFRYSRMLFALIIGTFVFGERPDALMLIGSTIIVASGLFTLWRERKINAAA